MCEIEGCINNNLGIALNFPCHVAMFGMRENLLPKQQPRKENVMCETITLTSWHSFKVGSYREVEYACNYYYENGKCVGNSELYYTGRYR